MTVLAWTLLIIASLVLALISIPIDLAFEISRTNRVTGRINLRWLFGLIRFGFDIPAAGESPRERARPQKQKPAKTKEKKSASDAGNWFKLLRQRSLRRRITKFIRDLFRATHARDFFLRVRIGLGDPADTGRLWGLVGPVAALAPDRDNARVIIEPEFMDPVFAFWSHGRFRLIPIQFLGLAIAFLLSPPIREARRTIRQGRS